MIDIIVQMTLSEYNSLADKGCRDSSLVIWRRKT